MADIICDRCGISQKATVSHGDTASVLIAANAAGTLEWDRSVEGYILCGECASAWRYLKDEHEKETDKFFGGRKPQPQQSRDW
jgi:hypothetical protein